MTPANPQPRPCGDVSPCAPLHGWRLWVANTIEASVNLLVLATMAAALIGMLLAADHHTNARRHAVHQGE